MRKLCSVFIAIIIFIGIPFAVNASESMVPYDNYTYTESGTAMKNPQAYIPSKVIYGADFGIGNFSGPTDIDVDENGDMYILDVGNNRVVILDKNLKYKNQFLCNAVLEDGAVSPISGAQGITVTGGTVYISDTENSRILLFNLNGKYLSMVTTPEASVLDDDFVFKPIKTSVDSEGNYYVVSMGTYDGVLNIKKNGSFLGFVATNKVTATAWTLFWRRMSTIEQRKNSEQLIPQDFSSIDIDSDGFYFITTKSGTMVKRCNPGGSNVIRSKSAIGLVGDPATYYSGTLKGTSSFVDVSAGPNKTYACLDKTRGRVFCYNNDGYMLYSFGNLGSQNGSFVLPVAISYLNDDRVAVLDATNASITVFESTEYAKKINQAIKHKLENNTEEMLSAWREVLALNSKYTLALNMMGKAYYESGDYETAKKYFKEVENTEMYSAAKEEARAEWIFNNSWIIMVIVIGLLVFLIVNKVMTGIKKRRKGVK